MLFTLRIYSVPGIFLNFRAINMNNTRVFGNILYLDKKIKKRSRSNILGVDD